MQDFRKHFRALAVVALLLAGLTSSSDASSIILGLWKIGIGTGWNRSMIVVGGNLVPFNTPSPLRI